jgi:hypothetical protein
MNSFVKHVPKFMNALDATNVYMYAKDNDLLFTEYGNNEKEFTFHANFTDIDVKNILDEYGKKVWDFVSKNYEGNFLEYDNSKTHLARFSEGYGMHEHFDSTKPNDIATLIYINDNYDGGDIYFPELDISIKPEAGDLICFPDTPDFVHGVKPITSGIRYTSPRWITRSV